MADTRRNIRIEGTDDLSGVLARVGAAGRRMGSEVDEGAEDARTAVQRLADALATSAEEGGRRFERLASIADDVGNALGPELAAKIDRADLVGYIADLEKTGVSLEELEADVDALAESLRRIDSVQSTASDRLRSMRGAADEADGGLRQVHDSADQSRSVLANMVGNSAQDLGTLGGVAGSAGVALGQLAEYAADGNISLLGLAKVAGPLAAVGLVINHLSKESERLAEIRAFDAEQVDEWAEAIRGGSSAVDAMVDSARDLGKLELSVTRAVDAIAALGIEAGKTEVVDLTSHLATLGLTVEQFAQLTEGSTTQLLTWAAGQRQAGADAEALSFVLAGVDAAQEQYTLATEQAARMTSVYGEAVSSEAVPATETFTSALTGTANALGSIPGVAADVVAAYDEMRGAQESALGVQLSYEDALRAAEDALTHYNTVIADGAATERDRAEAGNDLVQQFLETSESARAYAETQATAAGRAATAQREGIEAQIAQLRSLADNLAPGSYVRDQLEGHIAVLTTQIPPAVSTNVQVTGVEEARRQVDGLAHAINGLPGLDRIAGFSSGPVASGPVASPATGLARTGPEVTTPEQAAAIRAAVGGRSVTVNINGVVQVMSQAEFDAHLRRTMALAG